MAEQGLRCNWIGRPFPHSWRQVWRHKGSGQLCVVEVLDSGRVVAASDLVAEESLDSINLAEFGAMPPDIYSMVYGFITYDMFEQLDHPERFELVADRTARAISVVRELEAADAS